MASQNKKKKARNSYMACANKTTMKFKRLNFYNKIDRAKNKIWRYTQTGEEACLENK